MIAILNQIFSKFISPELSKPEVVTTAAKLKVSLVIMLIAFFFSPPPIEKLTYDFQINDRWKAFSEQINGTYISSNYSDESHESKLTFRIFPSFLGKLSFSENVRTQMLFLYVTQVLLGFLSIYIILDGVYKMTGSWLYAKLATSGLMMMHLGTAFFYDISYFLDGIAFFLMILAMFTPSTILSVVFLFLGLWCDERVLLGGIGVVIFRNFNAIKNITFWNFLISKNSILFLLSAACYVATRVWMTSYYNITIPLGDSAKVGLRAIWDQRNHLAIAQLFTFEFYWLYIIPVLIYFFQKNKAIFVMISLYLIIAIGSTGIVMDVMRSVTYLFPFVILGIVIYHGQESEKKTNETALALTLFNVVIPNYRYFLHFYLVIPLPLKLIQLYFGY